MDPIDKMKVNGTPLFLLTDILRNIFVCVCVCVFSRKKKFIQVWNNFGVSK